MKNAIEIALADAEFVRLAQSLPVSERLESPELKALQDRLIALGAYDHLR